MADESCAVPAVPIPSALYGVRVGRLFCEDIRGYTSAGYFHPHSFAEYICDGNIGRVLMSIWRPKL